MCCWVVGFLTGIPKPAAQEGLSRGGLSWGEDIEAEGDPLQLVVSVSGMGKVPSYIYSGIASSFDVVSR